MEKPILAIISPCYNEEAILNKTYENLNIILQELKNNNKISTKSYISFVDDGSADKTWEIINNFSISGIKLSKNFGHQAALMAGLLENKADIYITLDADLQDDTSLIEQMVDKYNEGYEIVYGIRNDRNNDTLLKRILTSSYYKLTSLLKMNTIPHHGDFRLLSNKIVDLLRQSKEKTLYLRGIIPCFGFKNFKLYYKRQKRIGGTAKYTYGSLTKLAIDGITSFSTLPLNLIFILGLISFTIALAVILYILIEFFTNSKISSFEVLLATILLFGGIQLLSLGIIGEYLGKIYFEGKQRPPYIVEEKIFKL